MTNGLSRHNILLIIQWAKSFFHIIFLLQICLGDTIEVLVYNKLGSDELTFHWHGIRQKDSNHMDGVPMITQCPILPFSGFRYKIHPDSAGTYFYHAHSGITLIFLLSFLFISSPSYLEIFTNARDITYNMQHTNIEHISDITTFSFYIEHVCRFLFFCFIVSNISYSPCKRANGRGGRVIRSPNTKREEIQ